MCFVYLEYFWEESKACRSLINKANPNKLEQAYKLSRTNGDSSAVNNQSINHLRLMSKSRTLVWSTRTENGPSARWPVDCRKIWKDKPEVVQNFSLRL